MSSSRRNGRRFDLGAKNDPAGGFNILSARVGYKLGGPLAVSVGGGYDIEHRQPVALAGVVARTGGRIRLHGGADVMMVRAGYHDFQLSGNSTVDIANGESWRRAMSLYGGFEANIFNFSK